MLIDDTAQWWCLDQVLLLSVFCYLHSWVLSSGSKMESGHHTSAGQSATKQPFLPPISVLLRANRTFPRTSPVGILFHLMARYSHGQGKWGSHDWLGLWVSRLQSTGQIFQPVFKWFLQTPYIGGTVGGLQRGWWPGKACQREILGGYRVQVIWVFWAPSLSALSYFSQLCPLPLPHSLGRG